MIRWLLSLAVLMTVASCGESGTFVLLDIEYGDLDDVDELQITGVAADGTQLGMNVTGRVSRARIQLPDNTEGEVTVSVAASSGGVARGSGQDSIFINSFEENSAQVLLREPCVSECTLSTERCTDRSRSVCVDRGDGCFEWSPDEECPTPAPTCDSDGLINYDASCQAGICTVSEVRTECDCVNGACIGGCDAEQCRSPGLCQTDEGATCDENGCAYPNDEQGAFCNDGLDCTIADSCDEDGECVGADECDLPPPVCNGEGTELTTVTASTCLADGCSLTRATEECDCMNGACACTPRWTTTLLGEGLNARLAVSPGGQVHLARLGSTGLGVNAVHHSSPPGRNETIVADQVVDFRFLVTSDGTPHVFAQHDLQMVQHYHLDTLWIADMALLNNAIAFAVAVTPSDAFHYYYRATGGIFFQECVEPLSCSWTSPISVSEGGGPIDAAATDEASHVLIARGGMTYLASTEPGGWDESQLSEDRLDAGAMALGASNLEYTVRTGMAVFHGRPGRTPVMITNSAIHNVDVASDGQDTFVAYHVPVSDGLRILNLTSMVTVSLDTGEGAPGLPQIEFDDSGAVHLLYESNGELTYATSPCL